MGTTVQEAGSKLYSDLSGIFYEGMKKEDAENKKGIFNIFYSPVKEFDRIDKDHNGILSKDEITEELRNDAESNREAIKSDAMFGIGFAGLGLLSRKLFKKTNKFVTCMMFFELVAALHSKRHQNIALTRIAQGCN